MWEAMAGSEPWKGMSNQDAGKKVVRGDRLPVPKGDPVVAQLVTECWAADPDARPSLAQLQLRLMNHLDSDNVPTGSVKHVMGV